MKKSMKSYFGKLKKSPEQNMDCLIMGNIEP